MDTLTLRETAQKIGVHRNTLRKYMRTGLPYLRCPGARRIQFVWAEIDAWLRAESNRIKAETERQTAIGRLRALIKRTPKPPTRKEERAALKQARAAKKRASRPGKKEVTP